MDTLKPAQRAHVLGRTFAVQGSWNYRTMLGAGVAFALVPVLRRIYRDRPEELARALGRHAGFFNAHPYMASVAIGALARLETEGAAEDEIDRLRRALVGPLGVLGDRLIWARWRPFCILGAIALASLGAPWWVVVTAFLVTYNAVHLKLRAWSLDLGWREGRHIGTALRDSVLRRLPDRLTIPIATVAGVALPPLSLVVAQPSGVDPLSVILIAPGLAAAGYLRPTLAKRVTSLALLAGAVLLGILATIAW